MKTKLLAGRVVRVVALMVLGAWVLPGCSQPTLFPNPDPSLRKTKAELEADAAKRAYKADAPRAAEPKARAQVGYMLNRLEVVNFTDEDWSDVEVWVNGKYVCYVPKMESRKLKEIHFPMLYDANGKPFPMNGGIRERLVRKVELYREGTMYEVVCHNADF